MLDDCEIETAKKDQAQKHLKPLISIDTYPYKTYPTCTQLFSADDITLYMYQTRALNYKDISIN